MRRIAADARVDPGMLVHYFGTKENLFLATMDLPTQPAELFGDLRSLQPRQAAEAIVRGYLQLIDRDDSRSAVLALVRSAVSNEKAAAMLREFAMAYVLTPITQLTNRPDAPLRASLVVAQLVGIAVHRHVVRVGPLAQAGVEDIVALVAPTIEQYLT